MFAVSLALLAHAFPGAKERAGALAVYGATIGASFAVGPLVGGALTSGLDWRWVFLINVPIGIARSAMTRARRRGVARPTPAAIDWPARSRSPAACSCSSSRCCAATRRAGAARRSSWSSPAPSCCSPRSCSSSTRQRADAAAEPVPQRHFTGAQIAAFAISASLFAVFIYITLYLQQILGLTAVEAGLVYIPGTMVNLVVAGATASMLARRSRRGC